MTFIQIKEQVKDLSNMDDTMAYEKGLVLLNELRQYRNTINRKEYKTIENKIQEERFR